MENIHTRSFLATPEAIRSWLEHAWSGTANDIFPYDLVPTWRSTASLETGRTVLGHGPFAFKLCQWDDRGWKVEFRSPLARGWHGFELVANAGGAHTIVRHTLTLEANPAVLWLARAFLYPIHDWAVEALFDRLEAALATGVVPMFTARPLTGQARFSWQLLYPGRVHNVHTRDFTCTLAEMNRWTPWLWSGTEQDAFPRDQLASFRSNSADGVIVTPPPLEPGITRMGHGPIRFRLDQWDGHNWAATFLSKRLVGRHGFVLSEQPGGTRMTHVLTAKLAPGVLWKWVLFIRPIHDWVVESLFDRLTVALTTGRMPTQTPIPLAPPLRWAIGWSKRANDGAALPFIDEHAVTVPAERPAVWTALLGMLDQSRSGLGAYARAVGCADYRASGPRPLEPGSTLVGFRVTRLIAKEELVLSGRHRFANYSLAFRIDPVDGNRCRLVAETRADFPGWAGKIYRGLVIRSGAHALVTRGMLSGIKRRVIGSER